MELVYLYIKSFRNLNRIGFNFSEKRKVVFDELTLELKITDSVNPRPDFFGSQITNVTAVIGKNGTGKSNLLELICYLTKGSAKKISDFIIVYEDGNETFVYKSNLRGLFINRKNKLIDIGKSLPYISNIFFSNIHDGREHNFSKDVIDISQNRSNRIGIRSSDAFNQLKFLLSDSCDRVDLDPPSSMLLSGRPDLNLKKNLLARLPKDNTIVAVLEKYKSGFSRAKPHDQLRYIFRYSFLIYVINYVFSNYSENVPANVSPNDEHFLERFAKLEKRHFSQSVSSNIQELHHSIEKFLENFIFEFESIGKMHKPDFGKFLDFDKVITGLEPQIFEEKIARKIYFKISFSLSNQRVLRQFTTIFDYPEVIDVEWVGLSSGHKAFLNLFAQIYSTQKRTSQHDHVIICIDEGDLYLHPEWQREFLNRIVTILPLIMEKNIQLILTTHSPFLISDLPKENIILIEKNKEGNCEIMTDEMELRQTFGANIYDLYKGPFVLEKSTVSEFALRKIKHAIYLLKKDNPSKDQLQEVKQVISAIGDEPVFRKLQQMMKDAENRL